VQVGKEGTIFLLDGNSLGGYQQGAGGTDKVLQKIGPYGGVWSKPAVWGGDGGWVYIPEADTVLAPGEGEGYLRAYRSGADGSGKPTLTLAGSSTDYFGFSSSAPVVTSHGTAGGSALLWIVWNPDHTGVGAQLRAYDPVPVSGALQLRFSAPVGTGSKFNPPGISGNHLYVGTRDGHVLGFGLPASGASVPDDPALSAGARLGAAYPNPFAGTTSMQMTLARSGPVNVTVFDASGRQVRRLVDGAFDPGSQRVVWDGRNDAGTRVPTGLYLVRMNAAGTRQAHRVMIVR
jgi:iron transport multicopper oxidase